MALFAAGVAVVGGVVLAATGALSGAEAAWPLAYAALCGASAVAMRVTPQARDRSRSIVYGLFYLGIGLTLALGVAHRFSLPLAVTYVFLITVLGVGGGMSSSSPRAIATCLVVAILGGIAAVAVTPEVVVDRLGFGVILAVHGALLVAQTVVRVRARARLAAERELYRDIITRTADGIALADAASGAILQANPAFDRIVHGTFGRTLHDILGLPPSAPLAPEALNGMQRLHWARGIVPAEISASGVRVEGREAVALVARDASERVRIERELRDARDRAEAAATHAQEAQEHAEDMLQMKSAFLANMSHEVQTPLATISGYAEVLRDEIPATHAEPVQAILEGADRLHRTLGALLELADLEAGRLPIEHGTVDAAAIAEAVVNEHREHAEALALPLLFAAPQPAWALADRAALHRVVSYLVDNALKFTERGRVAVVVGSGSDGIEVVVRDSGIGMSQEDQERAFEAFRQLSSGDARSHEGSGLGLALARTLAEEMGGSIHIESAPGEGTLVRVRLRGSPVPTASVLPLVSASA